MLLKLGTISQKVAEWQKVIGLPQSGIFDAETDKFTRAWQKAKGLTPDGVVGTQTWAAAGVTTKGWYPPRPNFNSPTDSEREQLFGRFAYRAKNSTDIIITDGWAAENIVKVHIPQLEGVTGAPANGVILFHKAGAAQIKAFFAEVEEAGLLDLVISWAGSFYPRFVRGSRSRLSNHSWGTAFDINAAQNWLGQQPAAVGKEGSLLQLVPIANKHGFFWGGHYNSRLDGMHFELARIQHEPSDILELDDLISTAGDPAGSQDESLSFPTNNEVPLASTVEEPNAGAGTSPVAELPPPPANEQEPASTSMFETLNEYGARFQETASKVESLSATASSVSGSSIGTFLVTKLIGIGLMVWALIKDNWMEIAIGAAVICVAVWYFSRSKDRANERNLAQK